VARVHRSLTNFLIPWTFQGFYVVWLPLEVALIFDRGRATGRGPSETRKAAGLLIVALEAGAILGALAGGRIDAALNENVQTTHMVSAVGVTLVFFAILFGMPESKPLPGRTLDLVGLLVFVPRGRYELKQKDPAIDLRVRTQSKMWPVQLTAGLVCVRLFGAQAPPSTLAGTDSVTGYGLPRS
jgi:hypothetical protein